MARERKAGTALGEYLMNTLSLEDWVSGEPSEAWRRIRITALYSFDGMERIRATILEGPEAGRQIAIPTPELRAVRA